MAVNHDGVETTVARHGRIRLSPRQYLLFILFVVVAIGLDYLVIESYHLPLIVAVSATLVLLGFGIGRALRELQKQYHDTLPTPPTPAEHSEAPSETRIAVTAAIALSCGVLLPIVALSLLTDLPLLGASLRSGDYVGWLLRMTVIAVIFGGTAFYFLRRAIAREYEKRRRLRDSEQ